MKKKRKLTFDEEKQLSIAKSYNKELLSKKINWKKFTVLIVIEILSLSLFQYFNDGFLLFLFGCFAIFIPFFIWELFDSFKKDRKRSKDILIEIERIEKEEYLNVSEFQCRKAILFQDYEDFGNCYALEIEKNKLLFWWENFEFIHGGNFPNSKFEVYEDDFVPLIFGKQISISGENIQPIIIDRKVVKEIFEILEEHMTIIDSNVSDFLEKIESELLTDVTQNEKS